MRSVPHRVVCLLGLDDGVFPRKAPRDGDDLMLDDPHVGDRDPRTEDRQLLLDALLAATDRLIVTYTGNDERTNLAAAAGGAGRRAARRRRPHGPHRRRRRRASASSCATRCSRSTRATSPSARSCRERAVELRPRHARRRAGADDRARAEPAPFLAGRCPPRRAAVVELEDLVRFAEHPVRAFLRQRLGISVGDFADEVEDALPVELDGLEQWGVGQRLLDARLAGVDGRRRDRRRDRARHAAARACSASPSSTRVLPDRRARSSAAAAALLGGDADAGLGRRPASRSPTAAR